MALFEKLKTISSLHLVLEIMPTSQSSTPLYGHVSFPYTWLLLCVVDEPEEWFHIKVETKLHESTMTTSLISDT